MKLAGVKYLDKGIKLANAGLNKMIEGRYNKNPYLKMVMITIAAYIGVIAVTGIMMWLLFDKYLDIGNSLNAAIQAAGDLSKETTSQLQSLDNIKSGSGLRPVSIFLSLFPKMFGG